MEKIYLLTLAPILGAILGSFSTMLIYRLYHDQPGILWGRSQCPDCKHVLGWSSLVPIFSWLSQRGKCQYCSKKISAIYPVIELVFATLFFLFVQKYYSIELWWMLPMVFLLLVLFFYDWWFMQVDLRIVVPAILLALLAGAFWRDMSAAELLFGGLIGFGFYAVQYFLSGGTWVGAGDMYLGALLGFLFGWSVLLVLLCAYILGTVIAVFLMITKGYGRKSKLPMGAFLMPAAIYFLYAGDGVWQWYLSYIGW